MTPMPYHKPCQNGFYDIFSGYVRFIVPFQGKSLFVVGSSLFVSTPLNEQRSTDNDQRTTINAVRFVLWLVTQQDLIYWLSIF